MSDSNRKKSLFTSAQEAAIFARKRLDSPQSQSASFQLAFQDPEFLLQDELRPVRLQLELLKPELIQTLLKKPCSSFSTATLLSKGISVSNKNSSKKIIL